MAMTLLIASLVLFVIGVSIIAYDVISTRKRRERSEPRIADTTARRREA